LVSLLEGTCTWPLDFVCLSVRKLSCRRIH
jgi:hypothetical protein